MRRKSHTVEQLELFAGVLARRPARRRRALDLRMAERLRTVPYNPFDDVRELENVIERAVLLSEGSVIHGHHLPPSLQLNPHAENREPPTDFNSRVRQFEIELITDALKETRGNQTQAAERLGMSKRMIQYKITNYGIDYKRFR